MLNCPNTSSGAGDSAIISVRDITTHIGKQNGGLQLLVHLCFLFNKSCRSIETK